MLASKPASLAFMPMNLLYNTGIYLYKAAAAVASWRSPKIREMLQGEQDTLSTLGQTRMEVAPDGYDVWIHVASLGEFEQGRPLMERLRRERPELKILLTFFSPSGYRVRHDYDKVDTVAYLPIDTPSAARKFIDAARPKMAIFVKYEFWGNYLETLSKNAIPTYIISAIFRPGQIFFRPFGGMFRKMLRTFKHLYVQDDRSKELLASIGIENVTVAGDTRFDRVTDIQRTIRQLPIIERFVAGSPFTLVVGSSWAPDEDIIIPWTTANNDVRLIIAPHEFNENRLENLTRRLGPGTARLSQISAPEDLSPACRAVIVDSFGLLSSIYRYAHTAYIGGGFGAGIHNINEAAVYGIPVVFGPRHSKFKEASDLIECGGGFEVTNRGSLATILSSLKTDHVKRINAGEAAGNYIKTHIGATDKIYADLF